jgi:hypothetical protein
MLFLKAICPNALTSDVVDFLRATPALVQSAALSRSMTASTLFRSRSRTLQRTPS